MLSGPDLAQLYRSADVMVFPSETDTFGLVLIESMACGTPVAALPATGPIDVVGTSGEGGVIDTDLKAACLAALRCDRTRVRAFAERYTWAAATRQFEQAQLRLSAEVVDRVTQVRQAWVRAVAAQQTLSYARQVFESAEAGAELDSRPRAVERRLKCVVAEHAARVEERPARVTDETLGGDAGESRELVVEDLDGRVCPAPISDG